MPLVFEQLEQHVILRAFQKTDDRMHMQRLVARALELIGKSLDKAVAKQSNDHLASIGFSMATLQVELGEPQAAIESLQRAQASAQTIEDNELKAEIDELLATLTNG